MLHRARKLILEGPSPTVCFSRCFLSERPCCPRSVLNGSLLHYSSKLFRRFFCPLVFAAAVFEHLVGCPWTWNSTACSGVCCSASTLRGGRGTRHNTFAKYTYGVLCPREVLRWYYCSRSVAQHASGVFVLACFVLELAAEKVNNQVVLFQGAAVFWSDRVSLSCMYTCVCTVVWWCA